MASLSLSTMAQFATSVTASITQTSTTTSQNKGVSAPTDTEVSAALSVKSSTSTATNSMALPSFKRHISTSYTRQTYYEMARAMKEEIEIKDRRYHLKVYKQCFLGSEAVTFIKQYLDLESREEALEVGKELNEKISCFEHVCGDHNLKDEKLFYVFSDLSKSQEGNLATLIKSRRTTALPTTTLPSQQNNNNNRSATSSLIDDSDTEVSHDEDERENSAPDLNLLMKGMDAALSEEQQQKELDQSTTNFDQSMNRSMNHSMNFDRSGRRHRSRTGSRGQRTRGDNNNKREASPTRRKEKRAGAGDNNKESEASPTRSPRKERKGRDLSSSARHRESRSPQRAQGGSRDSKDGGAGSRSPKPSQARISRKNRQQGRSRSKSPQKTGSGGGGGGGGGVQMERSNTFHGRGSRSAEARKSLMDHHQHAPSGNKRLTALKKKSGSISPVRKAVSDMSNYPESTTTTTADDDDDEKQQPKQRSASLKLDGSSTSLFQFPAALGDLPPRASSAPGRRGRSPPTKGKTPTAAQQQARVLDEAGKDFLQRGHASWGPDSDEFLFPFNDDDDEEDNVGHKSMGNLFSDKDREEVEARMAEQKKSMMMDQEDDQQEDAEDPPPKSRSSVEIKSRSSLEIKSSSNKSDGNKKSSRTPRAPSADAKKSQKEKADKQHSSLNKVLDGRKMILKATLGRKKSSDGKGHTKSGSLEAKKSRESLEVKTRPDGGKGPRSRPASVDAKSRPSMEIKAAANNKPDGKSLTRSKTTVDAKSRPSMDNGKNSPVRQTPQGLRRSQTTEAKPRSSLEKKTALSPKRSPRSRASVTQKVRSSFVIKSRAGMDKDGKSGLDRGSGHNKSGSNHNKSGLDKGSNHSLGSTGSAKSALLAALYSENNDDDVAEGSETNNEDGDPQPSVRVSGIDKISNHSLGSAGSGKNSALLAALYSSESNLDGSDEGGQAVRVSDITAGNDSVNSALNSSLLGELSDDEEFAE